MDALPPKWFDPELGLPKYELPPYIKEELNNSSEQKRIYGLFLKKLDMLVTDDIFKQLCDAGYEGYSIQTLWNKECELYSRHLQNLGGSGYVGRFTQEDCKRLIALLILNCKGLLAEPIENEKKAILKFKDYVLENKLPEWFTEDTTFAEI